MFLGLLYIILRINEIHIENWKRLTLNTFKRYDDIKERGAHNEKDIYCHYPDGCSDDSQHGQC